MTADAFILKKLFVKMNELQYLYDSGQIAPGSNECLDLLALKELESQLLETEHFVKAWTSLASLQTNHTQH